mmetsp:Transcript_4185/g.8254  ORF Transcript_4185/g.8254 Transcript_4185/m.8254 type:complete len:96 (-) Transcript_4185:1196-1483(-)
MSDSELEDSKAGERPQTSPAVLMAGVVEQLQNLIRGLQYTSKKCCDTSEKIMRFASEELEAREIDHSGLLEVLQSNEEATRFFFSRSAGLIRTDR